MSRSSVVRLHHHAVLAARAHTAFLYGLLLNGTLGALVALLGVRNGHTVSLLGLPGAALDLLLTALGTGFFTATVTIVLRQRRRRPEAAEPPGRLVGFIANWPSDPILSSLLFALAAGALTVPLIAGAAGSGWRTFTLTEFVVVKAAIAGALGGGTAGLAAVHVAFQPRQPRADLFIDAARAKAGGFLRTRRSLLLAAALGVALTAPSLSSGLALDDVYHRFLLTEVGESARVSQSYVSPFAIASGDPSENHWLAEHGYAPWWIADDLKISFWRPLSVLTHRWDYLVWPNSPGLMHAQNLMWYVAAILCIGSLYRSVQGATAAAGLATVLCALDHTHGLPVAWVANRNAVIALALGALALRFFVRWRQEGRARHCVSSLLAFGLGLLTNEATLAVAAYAASYAIFLDDASPRCRALSLVPFCVVAVAWRGIYQALGYGTSGSGLYVDPLTSPGSFLAALLERIPLLLLGQFGLPPAEAYYFSPETLKPLFWGGGVVLLVALVAVLWRLLRQRRTTRFWALSVVLSLVPACTTYAHNRLLMFASIGAMALLAEVAVDLAGSLTRAREVATGNLARRGVGLALVGVHALASPFILLGLSRLPAVLREVVDQTAVQSAVSVSHVEQRDLVILAAPDGAFFNQIRFVRAVNGRPQPKRLRALSTGAGALHVTRMDERTLDIRFEGGLLAAPLSQLYRNPAEDPFVVGQKVRLEGLTITVVDLTPSGLPLRAAFEFDRTLDSADFCWMTWQGTRYVPVTLPRVGGTLVLPPARNPLSLQDS